MKCSFGDKESRLKIPKTHKMFIHGKAQGNIGDFKPNENIMPFGKCSSLANPTVAAATAANNGVLKPMPCVPATVIPWVNGKADFLIENNPALINESTNTCIWCGLIEIVKDGQD